MLNTYWNIVGIIIFRTPYLALNLADLAGMLRPIVCAWLVERIEDESDAPPLRAKPEQELPMLFREMFG